MTAKSATRLEYALLGLIRQGIKSGYALRKQFASTPMGHFSDSPGSTYPALKRLERRGWIRRLRESGGPRRRQAYGTTKSGERALGAWVTRMPERGDLVRGPDGLVLRFAFLGEIGGRAAAANFLKCFERESGKYLRELRTFLRTMPAERIPTGRLALEHGVMEFEAGLRWARRAQAQLGRVK